MGSWHRSATDGREKEEPAENMVPPIHLESFRWWNGFKEHLLGQWVMERPTF